MYDIKEFIRVANAFHRTPIVDDDFPEMKQRYQLEFARLCSAVNGDGDVGIATRNTFSEVAAELQKARATHAAMNSHHEGYAVILEELEELWEICKSNTHTFLTNVPKWAIATEEIDPNNKESLRRHKRAAMRKEALQVAAMAVRFIEDVCDKQ